MAESFVQLPDDSGNTGKKEDHFIVDNGNYREAVVIGDAATSTAFAPVDATHGLAVDPKTLPPGAATAAKQPALGTAGTASTDVITVQGIASGTAQPVS